MPERGLGSFLTGLVDRVLAEKVAPEVAYACLEDITSELLFFIDKYSQPPPNGCFSFSNSISETLNLFYEACEAFKVKLNEEPPYFLSDFEDIRSAFAEGSLLLNEIGIISKERESETGKELDE